MQAQAPFNTDFAGWHLPLPAGQWTISRGPCGSASGFKHQCGYYEDHCALDLTSAAGSMLHVPVLAPQAGQVFFMGTRADSGLALLLRHADGRVSALMHLAKIVVAPNQQVSQGQVVAYAGNSGSSGRAHLHFHVQPNAVERACIPLNSLDEINFGRATATSYNRAWSGLVLVDPPQTLPGWLPAWPGAEAAAVLPAGVVLPPLGRIDLPLAIRSAALDSADVFYNGRRLNPTRITGNYAVYLIPLEAPQIAGEYTRAVRVRATDRSATGQLLQVRFSVGPPADTSAGSGIVSISPTFVSPANYSEHRQAPRLCWSEPATAGLAPLHFRVMVVGPQAADSGWLTATCWQAPTLPQGTYTWKVFVRDGLGFMNRTNQRPFVFKIR